MEKNKTQQKINISPSVLERKITEIKKRNGKIVSFDKRKIAGAILKTGQVTGEFSEKTAQEITDLVINNIKSAVFELYPSVEQIQELVEDSLIEAGYIKTAKSYIIYREQHARIRELKTTFESDVLVEEYLRQFDWKVKENANMSYSLQGLNNHVASAVVSRYWLNKIYPKEVRNAHLEGELHIHDLSSLAVYCCGWDLQDLLIKGFRGVSGKIESKPPKHLKTALGQIVNFFYTLQGEIAGAVAFSNFDSLLAPFIRYDKSTYEQVKQTMQEFVFNINVPTRVGFQTPFTNITMDLDVPNFLMEENVVIGGKLMTEKYKDFQPEMDMINRAFAEVMLAGDASGRVFTFPIPTYNITKDFDWENPVLKPVWEMTAKYGIPYFSNFVNSDMKPEDARSMCCRLRLDNRELQKRGGGLFSANPLTGSLGVVTINLPRIGYLSKDKKEFYQRLEKILNIAKESLEIKRKILEQYTNDGLYPYAKFYLGSVHERFGEYWKNHFSTIGINGMNEALLNLLGKDIKSKEGMKFAIESMEFMRDIVLEFQKETGSMYNLEATPAEGVTYRLAKMDKEKYPEIVVANNEAVRSLGAKPYYTNSTHLPVGATDDVFEALDLQDKLQTLYTGGTVLHGFVGEKINDPEVCKKLVQVITKNYHLPYFTITPTFSVCPKHGYLSGEHFYCPKCDEEMGYMPQVAMPIKEMIQETI